MAGKNRAKNSIFIDKTGETLATTSAINAVNDALTSHLEDNMPHLIKDITNNKTYRYGLQVKDGVTQLIYEEVL
jgi:hypothetical protein